jgi:hypothetical protein
MGDEESDTGFSEAEIEEWFEEQESSEAGQDAAATDDPAEKYARGQLRVVRETKDYQLD